MHSSEAITLVVFALGAFLIPLGSGRVGIPAAVGEIVYGVVVGPYVLGLVEPNPFTSFLAEFGFVFLMFLVGLELDFSRIERDKGRGLALAVSICLLLFSGSTALTFLFSFPPYLFLAFGAVSMGVILVTLAECRMTKTDLGQSVIFLGSLAEFVTIVLLTLVTLYHEFGWGWRLAADMAKLGFVFVAAYALLLVLRTLIWWHPNRFSRVVAAHDPSEFGVRAGMATMLVFVALAILMGIEAILGAFVAGALFSFVFREKAVLEAKMSSIGFGFFVPIFFIWVGTEFDLRAVMHVEVFSLMALFTCVSLAVKLLAAAPLLIRGHTWRETAGAALLLGTPLTLLVVIARLGVKTALIDETTAGTLILLALFTAVLFPWLFRLVMPPAR